MRPGHQQEQQNAGTPCLIKHGVHNLLAIAALICHVSVGCITGIDCAPTTVKIGTDTLRIDLHSPLPDGAVSDFGDAMKARGTLKREAQGCIRTLDTTQLHLMYAWHELLVQLSALSKW